MDKDYLVTSLISLDDIVNYAAQARSNPEVAVDGFPPCGAGNGYTPLELLLISLSSSVCSSLAIILREQMKRNVISIKARAKGYVRDEHPKVISNIDLELYIVSSDTEGADIGKALKDMQDSLCPVWVMLNDSIKIVVMFKLIISR